ncbi:TPA: ribonuclease T [Legionella pneumophila]|nr:ribonuclease T [Legionella pneumophila]HAU1577383.1 ribonuclease T [Legionella pneumophila]HAU1680963.1 ribonuclease T [Legionella pneumophila]HAU3701081.1 ribonuclease T [Legionella pneumophila]
MGLPKTSQDVVMIKPITLLLLFCSFAVNASILVNGTFEATKSCPAYLSKNRKSNPDNLMVEPNQKYQLKEINKAKPDWLRIQFSDHQPNLRWVSVDCGVIEYTERPKASCDLSPGMADSYVLALSSQPGFCETYGYEIGKPECLKLTKTAYQANHLILHGLWPNQEACGHNYGYCGISPRTNHCDYSPLDLSSDVAQNLKKLMPSYNYGSCLERHEWNKHGSCQDLSTDGYFSLAMRLTTEVNNTEFGQYLTAHRGDTVKLTTLRELIKRSFGENNTGKVTLSCKNGILVDIYIQLPALIPFKESLESLVDKASYSQHHDYCNSNVTISDFSNEKWL